MPSIHHEILINVPAHAVWDAVRDVGALHTRLVPGFVSNTEMLAEAKTQTRRVTFANGVVVDEVIVDCDDQRQRLVWTIKGVEHHNGVMTVAAAESGAHVTWTADVLPAELAGRFAPSMAAGLAAMKAHLEMVV
ncbi:MAG: SRPBCC family protein [Hyphomonadaceae bacterium]